MVDRFTKRQRSAIMSRVPAEDTTAEKAVRCLLHRMGYRFRVHRKDLPGKPDLVLAKHKAVVFVNGCFWHGHKGCERATRPSSNTAYWNRKIDGNMGRDNRIKKALRKEGWRVLTVWECELADTKKLGGRIRKFFFGATGRAK